MRGPGETSESEPFLGFSGDCIAGPMPLLRFPRCRRRPHEDRRRSTQANPGDTQPCPYNADPHRSCWRSSGSPVVRRYDASNHHQCRSLSPAEEFPHCSLSRLHSSGAGSTYDSSSSGEGQTAPGSKLRFDVMESTLCRATWVCAKSVRVHGTSERVCPFVGLWRAPTVLIESLALGTPVLLRIVRVGLARLLNAVARWGISFPSVMSKR